MQKLLNKRKLSHIIKKIRKGGIACVDSKRRILKQIDHAER